MLVRLSTIALHLGTRAHRLALRVHPTTAQFQGTTKASMKTTSHTLSPPSLEELAQVLSPALKANFKTSSVTVERCPDLRKPPFYLATEGLSGQESVADIGGQPNLFPQPRLECKYSLLEIAKEMEMSGSKGQLLGAGAGPFHVIGMNSELSPNLSWEKSFDNVNNLTYYTKIEEDHGKPTARCEKSPCADCALMMNLYGSTGNSGPVLKITARTRTGSQKSFTECIRRALFDKYGDAHPISIGGVFVMKTGKAQFHVMPDFPPAEQLPWTEGSQVNDWLTWHEFIAPIVCLTVFHSADPGKKLGLRMEHTHCFTVDGTNQGGHYHHDLDVGEGVEDVEYEAYFNAAKMLYRIDKPEVTLERGLHD